MAKTGANNGKLQSQDLLKRRPASQPAVSIDGQIVCANCGAEFSADEPRCPYCDAFNPLGAEKEYMDELADIKDDTSELVDEANESFKDNLKHNARKTVTIVIIFVAVLATLFLAVTCSNQNDERRELQEYQAREAFRTKYFEEFDRLYEAGDDDALSDFVWSLSDDPGFDALFSWKHAGYLEVHDRWQTLKSAEYDIKAGNCDLDDYRWLIMTAIRLARPDTNDGFSSTALSQEEEKRAAGYRAYARQFLQDTLQLSEEEVTAFIDNNKDEKGAILEDKLRHNLEERLEQSGILRQGGRS